MLYAVVGPSALPTKSLAYMLSNSWMFEEVSRFFTGCLAVLPDFFRAATDKHRVYVNEVFFSQLFAALDVVWSSLVILLNFNIFSDGKSLGRFSEGVTVKRHVT